MTFVVVLDSSIIDRANFNITDNLPIYLSTLDCDSDDRAIIDCSITNPLGLTECDHTQDVFVHCEGMFFD